MLKKIPLLAIFLFLTAINCLFSQTIVLKSVSATNPVGFVMLLPNGYSQNAKNQLYVFMHGIGGRGAGDSASLSNLVLGLPNSSAPGTRYDPEIPKELQAACNATGFVLLCPQTAGDWQVSDVNAMVAYAKSSLSIDWVTNRNVVCGLSLGGGGVWRYISSTVANAQNFATAIICCGLNWISSAQVIHDSKIAIWAFHAQDDGVVAVSNATSAIAAVNATKPLVPAYLTLYTSGNHYIWGRVYSMAPLPGINNETVNVYGYAALNQVGQPVPVPALTASTSFTANAGPDQSVTAPNISLNGVASGPWTSAGWGLVTVPTGVNIYSPIVTSGGGWITATATLPVTGTYVFRLQIKNAAGNVATDDVTVTYTSPTRIITNATTSLVNGQLTLTITYSDGTTQTLTYK